VDPEQGGPGGSETIEIPDEAVEYILFQRTHLIRFHHSIGYRILERLLPFSIYERAVRREACARRREIKRAYVEDLQAEFEILRPHLPAACRSLLDIGCGVAGIDVLLSRFYRQRIERFHLVDKTQVEERIFYGFKPCGAFYNSLVLAKSLLCMNSVAPERVLCMEADTPWADEIGKGSLDLVLSLLSWGFHYPVAVYLEVVARLLARDGRVILDVRRGTDGIERLVRRFGRCEVIHETGSYRRVLCAEPSPAQVEREE